MGKICLLIKKEAVLFIALVLALVSIIFIPPDLHYFSYIDYSALVILFSLMIVVAGIKDLGVFNLLAQKLLARSGNVKFLLIILVNCVFICSMFMTNDVALITFVPITLRIFSSGGHKKLIFIIVMETLAANLGSMLTPIRNPQNLYIYSFYRLHIVDFLSHFLEGRVFIVSILSSQVISNVPAAMMISRFTQDVRQLLLGVNIGGLGTPMASLASLISFRIYSKSESSAPGKFLGAFAIYNVSVLLLVSVIFAFTL